MYAEGDPIAVTTEAQLPPKPIANYAIAEGNTVSMSIQEYPGATFYGAKVVNLSSNATARFAFADATISKNGGNRIVIITGLSFATEYDVFPAVGDYDFAVGP